MRVAPIAIVVVAIVLAASFALQAAGLPPAARGDVVAAKAAEWLGGYRYARSDVELAGRGVRGSCFHGWFGGPDQHADRGTLLRLGLGTVTLVAGHRLAASGLPASLSPSDALLLAGCTRVLSSRLDALAIAHTASVKREELWHRRLVALTFPGLTLFVEPKTDKPLGVELAGLRSRIHLIRLMPGLDRHLQAQ